jgi:hypothetical protein
MESKKRQANAWVQAVKLFNEQQGGRWTIPRKPKEGESPSAEYTAVRELMKQFTRPSHDEPKEAREPKREVPKTAKAPRKTLSKPEDEEVVVQGPPRKVKKSKSKTAIAEMPAEAPAPVEAEAPKRGRGRPRKTPSVEPTA